MSDNQEETYDYDEGIHVTIPFGEKRLETIKTIADALHILAKSLNNTPSVTISNVNIKSGVGGTGISVGY